MCDFMMYELVELVSTLRSEVTGYGTANVSYKCVD